MRDIKFRAKPNKAYFFESDNVPTTDGFVFGTPDTRMLNVPGAEKWRKEHEMVDQPSIVAMTRDGWPYSVVVIEETIGEFTGLHDKNGKEIYEHDIVRHTIGERKDKTGEFVDDYRDIEVCYDSGSFNISSLALCLEYVEVIGNIFDNTKLLKT